MVFDLKLPAGCPKEDASEFEGTVYRLVQTDTPTDTDLLTYLELNRFPALDSCKRGAISLFCKRVQAQHRLDISPHLGKHIASIGLTAAHGRCSRPSKAGHMSWWPYSKMRNPADLKVIG